MKFKYGALLLGGALAASSLGALAGCSQGNSALAKEMFGFGDEYYSNVESRYALNYDEMIYDDFTGGEIDKDKWVVSDSVWDQWGTDQNGVRPQNLFLVDDPQNPETHLLLRGNGSYYSGGSLSDGVDGLVTGASISTVDALGPGRYDIKMKACPRIGALTSMWLFSWFNQDDGSVQQNEIDIEIGLKPEFQQVFFTTWTSPSNNSSYPTDVDFSVNDGDWHVYSFDWVTDAEVPYVDYYIDGQLIRTNTSNVPTTNATLTIGLWVPSWAGGGVTDEVYNISNNSRMFDSDYAQVSWWRYVPFQMGGWEQRPVTNRNYDPDYQPEVLTSLPVVNKVANGDFEHADEDYYPRLREAISALPNEISALEREIATITDPEQKQKKSQELLAKQSTLTGLNKMLVNDPAPWKDNTITDTNDSFFVEGSSAERVLDPASSTNYCAKIVNGGSYKQWLRGATDGFRYRLKLKYKTVDGVDAAFRYIGYNGYSTSSLELDTVTIKLPAADEWTEFTADITIDQEGAQSICYFLELYAVKNASGTAYFDDVELVYLGH